MTKDAHTVSIPLPTVPIPLPTKPVHVVTATKTTGYIEIHACPETVVIIRQMGSLRQQANVPSEVVGDKYTLKVSPLYSFEEVLTFLQAWADVPINQKDGEQDV